MNRSLADASGHACVSERIAAYVAATNLGRIPAEVADRACDLILDAIGCGLAALGEPFVTDTVGSVTTMADAGARGVLGSPHRIGLRDAVRRLAAAPPTTELETLLTLQPLPDIA